MFNIDRKATWHKESYDRFLNEQLPQLLAKRLPLAGYQVESTARYHCQVVVAVMTEDGQQVEVTYEEVPQPDQQGLFLCNDIPWAVVPLASSEDLESATVLCVGDMLEIMLAEWLGEAPPNLPWDEALLRAWLPLDQWIRERFNRVTPAHPYDRYFQRIDDTNWLARRSHLRRLFMQLSDPTRVITAGQLGRLCPYEKPEGPNMGRIGVIAVGATIREQRVVVEDERPVAGLGLSMSAIPLVEHTDANRLLMGANMMRQWLPYTRPEPALVQSGNEPAAAEFWCGRNLLTAFLPWGTDTVEDAIVLSESGARHLSDADHQVEPGDKLSNRYGSKGVISRILPDAEMPKFVDGTPVQLIFNGVGLHSRMNFGQLWEAVLGRLARAEGEPIVAPPFAGPTAATIQQRLTAAGLPADGMEQLHHGENDTPLAKPNLVGWLYWGRTNHLVRDKLRVATNSPGGFQRQSELEYQLLREVGADALIHEYFHRLAAPSRSVAAAATLSATIEAGIPPAAEPPTPRFQALQDRLAAAGIVVTLEEGQLHFRLNPPTGQTLVLARPISHPWLGEQELLSIGRVEDATDNQAPHPYQQEREPTGFGAVVQSNTKLARLIANQTPVALQQQAYTQLETAVQNYFSALLTPLDLHFDSRVYFSGRTVLAPTTTLNHAELGLAEEMAWQLFAPQVIHKLNREGVDGQTEVGARTSRAGQTLDAIMAQSWVILHRVPTTRPTAMVAFRPVRIPDQVIRIPSLACLPLSADFDGDQVALFLPISDAAQRDAGERLSLVGHLTRDPALLQDLVPYRDPMLGLALHSLQAAGRDEIAELLGTAPDFTPGYLTRSALQEQLQRQLASEGAQAVLETIEQLTTLGFDVLKTTGISLSPFCELGLETPPPPSTDRPDLWENYMQQRLEQILAAGNGQADWGHYLLASQCGALDENRLRPLLFLLVARGVVTDVHGNRIVIPQSLRDGLTPEQHVATVAGAQLGLRAIAAAWEENSVSLLAAKRSTSFHVLARARRASNPGVVFARAAAMHEVDPLVDVESCHFVGMEPVG